MKCMLLSRQTLKDGWWIYFFLVSVFVGSSLLTVPVQGATMTAAQAFKLGQQKEQQLEYTEAQRYYEQAIRLVPNNAEYLDALGILLYRVS